MNPDTKHRALYTRNPKMAYRSLDGSGFLADQEKERLFHLNETGVAIWNILSEPCSLEEIIELMQTAFPDTPEHQIERDISKTFKKMLNGGAVTPFNP